jgi:hypothetical protein
VQGVGLLNRERDRLRELPWPEQEDGIEPVHRLQQWVLLVRHRVQGVVLFDWQRYQVQGLPQASRPAGREPVQRV